MSKTRLILDKWETLLWWLTATLFFVRSRNIRKHDEIRIVTPTTTMHYFVELTKVIGPFDTDVLDPTPGAELTLITCYPFDFVGKAPMRFLVRAVAAGMGKALPDRLPVPEVEAMTDTSGRHPVSVIPAMRPRFLPCVSGLSVLYEFRPTPGARADKAENPFTLRVDVGMVVLHATVQDGKGRIVSGLQKENFKVAENGIPQEILLFQREDIPVTVGIILDTSGSMRNKDAEVVAAALAFARSCNPQDEMFVVGFNDDVLMGLPPTSRSPANRDLRQAFSRLVMQGRTKLYDGLHGHQSSPARDSPEEGSGTCQ